MSTRPKSLAPGLRPVNRAGTYGRAFSPEDVRMIRRQAAEGRSRLEIARGYSVSKETIERLLTGQTYSWVPFDEVDGLAEEQLEKAMARRVEESFEKLQRMLGEGEGRAASVPDMLRPNPEGIKELAERLRARGTREGPRPKRYHPLLAQGWRYCDGQLTSPQDIEMLGLEPDEDQSEKEPG